MLDKRVGLVEEFILPNDTLDSSGIEGPFLAQLVKVQLQSNMRWNWLGSIPGLALVHCREAAMKFCCRQT